MTVLEFAEKNGYDIISNQELAKQRKVNGVYVCDLLSMVMARIKGGNIWVTVHTHINIIAVASLTDPACIIIPESIPIEELTIKKSLEQEIVLLRSCHTAYEICARYYEQSGGYLP